MRHRSPVQERGDPQKPHRHDIGSVAHGALHSRKTTEIIQIILGLLLLMTAALLLYTVVGTAAGTWLSFGYN